MPKMISKCPACGTALKISALHCSGCGLELRNDFELSPFDSLDGEQEAFLISFLKQKGNISSVQSELGISYQTAKKRLDSLLTALGLAEHAPQEEKEKEDIDMSNWFIEKNSTKASDIIKRKLAEHNGRAVIRTAHGLPCEIWGSPDGVSFLSDKLPKPFRYEVFDVIVNLLVSQGGRARKGNGRNYKLGDAGCDETTVVGAIGYHYFQKTTGESTLDPVFVLASILEWAGIARNGRGELILAASYQVPHSDC